MSQDEQVVIRWFERLAAGDPGVDFCSPDIEIRNWSESPAPGPFVGPEGVRKWWRTVNDPDIGTVQLFELEDAIDLGQQRILTLQRARGRARYSGIRMDQRWGSIITVRGGKIASAVGYPTQDEARAAAGLSR